MKRSGDLFSKKGIVLTAVFSIAIIVSIGFATTGDGLIKEKFQIVVDMYQNKEKAIKKDRELTKYELIEEIEILVKDGEISGVTDNSLLPFATAIFEREDDFNNDEILDLIKDKKKDNTTKHVLIDLYTYKNSKEGFKENRNELKKLLTDKSISNDLKVKILNEADVESTDEPLLIELVSSNENGDLAFVALKKLENVNAPKAYKIAFDILKNKENETKEKVSASLKVSAEFLKKNNDLKEEEQKFVKLSKEIMQSQEDKFLHDSAFFAISDLNSEAGVLSIVSDPKIENSLKVFAIDQNYRAIQAILRNNPSEEEISLVIDAMYIYPISELVEDLESIKNLSENPELVHKISETITFIHANGQPSNPKWED